MHKVTHLTKLRREFLVAALKDGNRIYSAVHGDNYRAGGEALSGLAGEQLINMKWIEAIKVPGTNNTAIASFEGEVTTRHYYRYQVTQLGKSKLKRAGAI